MFKQMNVNVLNGKPKIYNLNQKVNIYPNMLCSSGLDQRQNRDKQQYVIALTPYSMRKNQWLLYLQS